MSDLLAELEWRGFVYHATQHIKDHLQGRRTVYCGFDPTAPSLQLGNLMPLMLLRHFQLRGHKPIVLMGGGTGLIGDPSGQQTERPLLSKEQIRDNVHRHRDQVARLLDFDARETRALVLNNADWLVEQRVVDFLRDVGKHFTVNVMLQKESVKARLDAGISYTEFSYMLLQAYDFLHLFRKEQCTIQVGGSDQWGNITAGIDPHAANDATFDVLAQELPTATVAARDGLSLVDAVVQAGLAKSKSEARRSIEQGGIYVNQARVKDVARSIGNADWLAGRNLLLRKGKKDYGLLRLGK